MTILLELALELANMVQFTWFLVFLRIGAVMALLPAFGERSVPVRVRLALTVVLTLLVLPSQVPDATPVASPIAHAAAEVIIGLVLGMALRLAVLALQIAGTIAANVTSLSQVLGTVSVDPLPAMAHLLFLAGLAAATAAGLHVKVVEMLLLSYALFPPGQFPDGGNLVQWGVSQVAGAFTLAFKLAAPFVAISLIYNAALGAINRAMPQLMVAFVGAPAITFGALLLLALLAPDLLHLWLLAFDEILSGAAL